MQIRSSRKRINRQIFAKRVRLIDHDEKQRGIVDKEIALAEARENDLDLVEIAPEADPPVCKIMDYGKYQFEQNKKTKEGKKRQKAVQLKEIKLGLQIADHDLLFKVKKAQDFLTDGHKLKIVLFFKGREIAHADLGRGLMMKLIDYLKEFSVVETRPSLEGKRMVMILVPVQRKPS
ncbi:MAG: translation initiation factor IF-3 [bacterium]|nr:translation initiation factor IF-3 [bacterium]